MIAFGEVAIRSDRGRLSRRSLSPPTDLCSVDRAGAGALALDSGRGVLTTSHASRPLSVLLASPRDKTAISADFLDVIPLTGY